MEKKMLLKWTKGLLALVLAFLMLFGNGMDVFAAEHCIKTGCGCGRHHLQRGDIISWGDRIYLPDNSNISAKYSSAEFSMGGKRRLCYFSAFGFSRRFKMEIR